MRSDESVSTVSARRRSVQCTSRHTTFVDYYTSLRGAHRPTEAQGRSLRAPLGRYVPCVSCTLPLQIRPTEITDWLKARGRGVTGCGPPYRHQAPQLASPISTPTPHRPP